jgi:putative ABC transport system ATP-binding protein
MEAAGLHCLAALDDATSGQVFVGDADLTRLGDKELTRIRRDCIGFVFQAFNLVPTLTAVENITLPMDIAGRMPDKDWLDTVIGA